MLIQEHSHNKTDTIIFFVFLAILFNSCASLNAPIVFRPKMPSITQSLNTSNQSSFWTLDSLTPTDDKILKKRLKTDFTVLLKFKGYGNYMLQFSVNGKNFNPTAYYLINNGGDIEANYKVSKSIKIKTKILRISVALYKIEKNESGKAEICTLLKQIRREYLVQQNYK